MLRRLFGPARVSDIGQLKNTLVGFHETILFPSVVEDRSLFSLALQCSMDDFSHAVRVHASQGVTVNDKPDSA